MIDYGSLYKGAAYPLSGTKSIVLSSDVYPAGSQDWDWVMRIGTWDGESLLDLTASSVTLADESLTLEFSALAAQTDLPVGSLRVVLMTAETGDPAEIGATIGAVNVVVLAVADDSANNYVYTHVENEYRDADGKFEKNSGYEGVSSS
jgi:hypothetical protein